MPAKPEPVNAMELLHLRREVKTAVELAVIALCPQDLLERLAVNAGLLDAVAELPVDSPPVSALVPKLAAHTRDCLEDWHIWQDLHLLKAPV